MENFKNCSLDLFIYLFFDAALIWVFSLFYKGSQTSNEAASGMLRSVLVLQTYLLFTISDHKINRLI